MIFVSLTISGALYSFAFNGHFNGLALYLVTPLSALIGSLWLVNILRIQRIGYYIADVLSKQVKMLFPDTLTDGEVQVPIEVFNWERSSQRDEFRMVRSFVGFMVNVIAFCLSGLIAQLLLIKDGKGFLSVPISKLEFSYIYIFNDILICFVFLVFLGSYLGKIPFLKRIFPR